MTPPLLWSRLFLPAIIVAGAVMGAGVLSSLAPASPQTEPELALPVVDVVELRTADTGVLLRANGLVEPARSVQLLPEVTGRITSVSSSVRPGGRLSQGQVVARIDARDYQLALEQERSRVRQAELDLSLEGSRQGVAERSWELLGDDRSEEAAALALRRPHFASAELRLAAAQAGLERAELALERTALRAPFNAVVVSESLEVGQVVAPGSPLAQLVGTDTSWVRVSLPVQRLSFLDIPGFAGAEEGSSATVRQRLPDGNQIEREGRIVELLGQLDPSTRTAELLIEVVGPMDTEGAGLPLLSGAYVEVSIDGRALEGTWTIPRRALREGDHIWVVGSEEKLVRRPVQLRWADAEVAYIRGDFSNGERIITSALALPLEGMEVRVSDAAGER